MARRKPLRLQTDYIVATDALHGSADFRPATALPWKERVPNALSALHLGSILETRSLTLPRAVSLFNSRSIRRPRQSALLKPPGRRALWIQGRWQHTRRAGANRGDWAGIGLDAICRTGYVEAASSDRARMPRCACLVPPERGDNREKSYREETGLCIGNSGCRCVRVHEPGHPAGRSVRPGPHFSAANRLAEPVGHPRSVLSHRTAIAPCRGSRPAESCSHQPRLEGGRQLASSKPSGRPTGTGRPSGERAAADGGRFTSPFTGQDTFAG